MPPRFTYLRRIRFAETDLAGIVHFSNFYRFMEEAEHEFFRSLGLKIKEQLPDGTTVGWPRVRASCSFEAPAYYDDLIEIDVMVDRVGVRSLTLKFEIRRGTQRLARGEMKTVFCQFEEVGKLESIDIPPEVAEKLTGSPSAP